MPEAKIISHTSLQQDVKWGKWRTHASTVLIVLVLLGVALASFVVTSMPAYAATRQMLQKHNIQRGGISTQAAHLQHVQPPPPPDPCSNPSQISLDCLDPSANPVSAKSNIPDPAGMDNALFFYTPLDITINSLSPGTQTVAVSLWQVMLDLVDVCLVLILTLNGLRIIFVGTVFRYSDAVEALPGILMALIAAHVSMIFIALFLGLNNTLTSDLYNWATTNVPAIPSTTALTITPSNLEFTNFAQNLESLPDTLGLIIKILGVMLLAQIIVRIFFINLYIILAPLGIACWALPGKVGQPLTRAWVSGFVSLALVQFVQVAALIIIQAIVDSFVTYLSSQLPSLDIGTLHQIVNIAILWFIFRIPALFPTAPMRSLVEVGDTMATTVGSTIGEQIASAQLTVSGIMGGGSLLGTMFM